MYFSGHFSLVSKYLAKGYKYIEADFILSWRLLLFSHREPFNAQSYVRVLIRITKPFFE